jgi:hypothetical protein
MTLDERVNQGNRLENNKETTSALGVFYLLHRMNHHFQATSSHNRPMAHGGGVSQFRAGSMQMSRGAEIPELHFQAVTMLDGDGMRSRYHWDQGWGLLKMSGWD